MKIKCEKPTIIENGVHAGTITDIQYRVTEPQKYQYTDVVIEFDGMQLKAGYPTKLMEESKLGLLLKRFGIVVALEMESDPDQLKGRQCEFMTMQKPGKNGGVFANIIPDSVKPLTEQVIHQEAEKELSTAEAMPSQ